MVGLVGIEPETHQREARTKKLVRKTIGRRSTNDAAGRDKRAPVDVIELEERPLDRRWV